MLYNAMGKGPFKMPGYHDKDAKRPIGIIYRPDTWAPDTVYYVRGEGDYDVVIPTVFRGLYFKVTNPGRSGQTEPNWPTKIGGTVTDGPTWEAVAYNLLPPSQDIVDSTWSASDGVVLTAQIYSTRTTQATISSVPAGVALFTVTNHTIKSDGGEDDVTLQFKVADA